MPKLILVFKKKKKEKKEKIFNRPKRIMLQKWVKPKCQMIRVLKRFSFD